LVVHSRKHFSSFKLFEILCTDDPNPHSPAQSEAFQLFTQNKEEYLKRVKAEAKKNSQD